MWLQGITMLINNFKNKFLDFFKLVFNRIFRDHYLCRIEKIDLEKSLFIIYCRGINTPIKLKFNEMINDVVVLSNFSPRQASWIGYYYGKYYKGLTKKNYSCSVPFDFSSKDSQKKYCITMVTRNGNLVYTDNVRNTSYTMCPIRIMSRDDLIMKFNSLQACYIGFFLAWLKKKYPINTPNTSKIRANKIVFILNLTANSRHFSRLIK